MKKVTLTLLALLTISSADSLRLKCSFPEYKDGDIIIYMPEKLFYYRGPGDCSSKNPTMGISDNSILIGGDYCSIDISRATGDVIVRNFSGGWRKEATYKGTCTKQMNVL
ncbi:MAG: hypothetical protein Q8J85_13725 [Sulfuricurvum sp.]|nr:hypothetical protein [Sulfuricurvum sp.]MDP3022495.1 hypothetical protein [Sulfuricurvum sp.]